MACILPSRYVMRTLPRSLVYFSRICLFVYVSLVVAGCQWMNGANRGGQASGDSSLADTPLVRENKRLKKEVESQALDLAKLRAEYQRQLELNSLLNDELANTQHDLDRVEKQFVSFEQRLKLKESKASAVAAVAEAELLFDKLQEDSKAGMDSALVADVTAKLNSSDDLIRKQNYAAAVYFSSRAMRILNQFERRKNMPLPDGDARIIAVSVANVRSGPGSRYDVVSKLEYGTVIVQLETTEHWSKIQTKSGESGWVHNSLIR